MNYDFSEQEQQNIAEVGRVVRAAVDAAKPDGPMTPATVRSLIKGLLADLSPTGYNSAGLSREEPLDSAAMASMEAFAGAAPEIFLTFEMSLRIMGRLIDRYGSGEQRQSFLEPLRSGEKIGAVGLSEESLNVVNDPLSTSGVRHDGMIRVSGRKGLVIGGAVADVVAVIGRLDDGLGVFLIDKTADGLIMDDYPAGHGYGPPAAGRLTLENCQVSPEAVIGPVEERQLLADLKTWEDQVMMAAAVGVMGSALFNATSYAKTHKSGGKPVIAYQAVGFKLAELYTLVQTSQLMAYKAAWLESIRDRELPSFTRCAKVFCTDAAETVSSGALSILSAEGFVPDSPVAAACQWAKFLQVAGTSTEIARVEVGDFALTRR